MSARQIHLSLLLCLLASCLTATEPTSNYAIAIHGGAGTFAGNETCAVSCTGIGEDFIRNADCYLS